jgi:group I intron endonuclease
MKNIKNLPKQAGIYLVVNMINSNSYVGQAKDIYKRFNSHHIYNYKNVNNCCYDTKFYAALRKYGAENFKVSVLELCEEKDLNQKEIFYIKKYNSFYGGYNSTEGGQNWSPNIHSEKTEEKRKNTRDINKSLQSENHPRAKMSNEEVFKVRQRYINGETVKQIYEDYKDRYSSELVFKRIIFGETYKTVGNIPSKSQIRYTNAKLTDTQVKEIRSKYQKGKISYDELGKEYGLCGSSISAIIKRKTYIHVD